MYQNQKGYLRQTLSDQRYCPEAMTGTPYLIDPLTPVWLWPGIAASSALLWEDAWKRLTRVQVQVSTIIYFVVWIGQLLSQTNSIQSYFQLIISMACYNLEYIFPDSKGTNLKSQQLFLRNNSSISRQHIDRTIIKLSLAIINSIVHAKLFLTNSKNSCSLNNQVNNTSLAL